MKKQNIIDNIIVGLILFAVMFFFVLYVRFLFLPVSDEEYCITKYGEDWDYEFNKHYGDYCVQVRESDLKLLNATKINEDIDEFCEVPYFWHLTKWNDKCSSFAKEKSQ